VRWSAETRTGWLVGLLAGVKPTTCRRVARKLIDDGRRRGEPGRRQMAGRPTQPGLPTIGVPCVVIAMTRDEAVALLEHSDALQAELGPDRYSLVDLRPRSSARRRTAARLARVAASGNRSAAPPCARSASTLRRLNGRRASSRAARADQLRTIRSTPGSIAASELRPIYRQIATACARRRASLFHGAIAGRATRRDQARP
jgi:hypothetical protein